MDSNYYIEDFTENNYKKIIEKVVATRKCILFSESDKKLDGNEILLRHDIDFSVHRAYKLAAIENTLGVRSTYYVWFNSYFYNVFENEIIELLRKISDMGHDIGVHFEAGIPKWGGGGGERTLILYRDILQNLIQKEVKSFSFHNPTDIILRDYTNYKYAGLINVYSKDIREKYAYCSDSNGYWRFARLEDFLNNTVGPVQVLTHPVWWTPDILYPRDRIERAIAGRAKKQAIIYDADINRLGRKNIGAEEGYGDNS